MNYQSKVLEFQLASGQPVHLKRDLTKEELDFRDSLLREEIRELREAIVDGNRVEILDALCDIIYVALGTCNTMSINHTFLDEDYNDPLSEDYQGSLYNLEEYSDFNKDYCISSVVSVCCELAKHFNISEENFKTALNRVHESNMSKFCNDIKTAERTRDFYQKQGVNTTMKPREKKFVIYREGDGKVLKSCDFLPPYLDDLV